LVVGLVDPVGSGVAVLVLRPLVALVNLVLRRMLLEFLVAVTRTADAPRRPPRT
jgi:hypothetical protein